MKSVTGSEAIVAIEVDALLEEVYPNCKYSYRSLLVSLGRGLLEEVVLPTLFLSYDMGIKEN